MDRMDVVDKVGELHHHLKLTVNCPLSSVLFFFFNTLYLNTQLHLGCLHLYKLLTLYTVFEFYKIEPLHQLTYVS